MAIRCSKLALYCISSAKLKKQKCHNWSTKLDQLKLSYFLISSVRKIPIFIIGLYVKNNNVKITCLGCLWSEHRASFVNYLVSLCVKLFVVQSNLTKEHVNKSGINYQAAQHVHGTARS